METTITTIAQDIGTFFTEALSWVGEVIDTIVAEPVLLVFCVCVPLVGLGVGLAKRLLSL